MDDRDLTSPVALPSSDRSPTLHMIGRENSDILLSSLRAPSLTDSAANEADPIDLSVEFGMPPAPADDPTLRVLSTASPGKERSGSVQNQALLDELLVAERGPPVSGTSTAANSAAGSPVGGAPSKSAGGGPGSPPAVKPSSTARGYLINPVQVRAASIADVISRATVTETPKIIPTALPLELKLPMALRCDFCVKFDSVCSQCHFKWKGILDSRRIVLFGNFSSVPDHRKVGILFASICHGSVAFVRHFLEAWPLAMNWRSRFFPLVDTRPVQLDDVFREATAATPLSPILDAGHVFPLHVAFHARRIDMANLLFDLGSIIRKSERGVAPMELLPTPLSDEWENLLETRDSFIDYNMKERAKRLRTEGHFADAAIEYKALLARNPRNENARCGVAKMAIEQRQWADAIQLCRAILAKPGDVSWVEFDTRTVHALLQEATRKFHEECHVQSGPALKPCGCIITDKTVISLRRRKRRTDRGQPEKQLLIEVFRDNIVPYCDCKTLWLLWQATRNPLIRRYAERIATACSIDTIGGMLAEEYGYAEMYDTLRQDMPPVTGKNAVLHNPIRLLGLQVTAMADFNTFFLRSAVLGTNPHFITGTGFFSFGPKKSSDRRMKLVATKDFRLYRPGIGKAFAVHDLAEWEVDSAATNRLLNNIAVD